jgi:hypothetical protein
MAKVIVSDTHVVLLVEVLAVNDTVSRLEAAPALTAPLTQPR